MPRPRKPARLELKTAPSGEIYWIIRDGERRIATGCLREDVAGAERALADYRADTYRPSEGHQPSKILISDVLLLYGLEKGPETARPRELALKIERLGQFWGKRSLAEVKRSTCREYARWRGGGKIAANRELSTLRAAIHYYHAEHTLEAIPVVTLAAENPPNQVALTREQAAKLLWAAWRARQTVKGGRTKRVTKQVMKAGKTKRPIAKHLARLILIGLYTGTRSGAILNLRWVPTPKAGHADLEAGVLWRAGQMELPTKKQKPPTRMSSKLVAHMKRWKRIDGDAGLSPDAPIVHWHGAPITKVNKAFRNIVKASGLSPDITPHVLRHTRATWLGETPGIDTEKAAASLGMTKEMFERVYCRRNPEFQKDIAEAY